MTVLFGIFRRCLRPDVLSLVIVALVFILDHLLNLSDGIHKFPWILMHDLLDAHALFIFIFNNWGSEAGNLWDTLHDTDQQGNQLEGS